MTGQSVRPARGLLVAILFAASSMLRCSVPEVHGASANSSGRDGGRGDAANAGAASKLPAPVERAEPESYGSELIGLTRNQLEARRGLPTEKHGNIWIYLELHPGCSDKVMSEVFTFKNGRVLKLTLKPRQTGKVCGFEQRRP